MVEVHAWGGSEARATHRLWRRPELATALHYDSSSRKIEDGDIVRARCRAHTPVLRDITRTIPANGKFTPSQREIYDIVLGAQNAPSPL